MVGQLLRLLWSHERAGNGRYRCSRDGGQQREREGCAARASQGAARLCTLQGCTPLHLAHACPSAREALRRLPLTCHLCSVVVTGDHSTPVEFGDHSHEPVPFAIAHLRHVVEAMGGDAAVQSIPLGGIPHPGEEGNGTAAGQAAEAAAGQAGGVEERQQQQQQQQQEGPPAAASQQYQQGPSAAAFRQQQQQHGGPPPASQQQQDEQQQQPQARWPSAVASFDEIAVAAGPLGRFPGSQVMPLVRQFIGLEAVG